MDPLASKYTVWKRILHKFQARRDIPFRKKFFVGYDLHGNTYWEFTDDGNMQRLRRKMQPYKEYMFQADYFSTIPPPWLQWLRRTRSEPPSVHELMAEMVRQNNVKELAQKADQKWRDLKLLQQKEHDIKLQTELDRVKSESQAKKHVDSKNHDVAVQETTKSDDPWAEANKAQKDDYNPIQSARIPMREK